MYIQRYPSARRTRIVEMKPKSFEVSSDGCLLGVSIPPIPKYVDTLVEAIIHFLSFLNF